MLATKVYTPHEISEMNLDELNNNLLTIQNTKPELLKLIQNEQNQIRKINLLGEYSILTKNEYNIVYYIQFLLISNN